MTAHWITGDTLTTLRQLPDGCVDLVLTSPPFLALRSYLPADDPAKPYEIGSESTPGEFLDVLLDITVELRRVLAPHGSIAVELGDTYSGSGGGGGDYLEGGWREGQQQFAGSAATMKESNAAHWRQKNAHKGGWPLAKSACLIPESYRWALAYGRNPFTGRTLEPWRVRNTVRWVRPNPPVGALGDKYRPATSEMVIACTSAKRYFDLDAVRTEHKADPSRYTGNGYTKGKPEGTAGPAGSVPMAGNPAGAPPLDWWNIPTSPYKDSHYATFPPALCEIPVKSMCPQRVCRVCGEPSRRIVETQGHGERVHAIAKDGRSDRNDWNATRPASTTTTTLGWTDCGHDNWRTGIVLDPFGGSGTTLAVATGHGRDVIGIDLDARNADLARERVGMWLTETTAAELAELLTYHPEAA